MPVNDRALFKAFQVFILDVLDALGREDDTEGDSSLRAAEREAAAAPVVARPRKAEREGTLVTAMLNIGLTKLTSTTMFCPSFQTILNYPIQKTKTRQWLPGGGGKAAPMQM